MTPPGLALFYGRLVVLHSTLLVMLETFMLWVGLVLTLKVH